MTEQTDATIYLIDPDKRNVSKIARGTYQLFIPNADGLNFRINRTIQEQWRTNWRVNNHDFPNKRDAVATTIRYWNEALGSIIAYAHNHPPCSLYRAYYEEQVPTVYPLVQWELWNLMRDKWGVDVERLAE